MSVLWSPEEISILTNNYVSLGPRGCARLLNRRTLEAVYLKARNLKLADSTRRRKCLDAINRPIIDVRASKKYRKEIYRYSLVGNRSFALVEKSDLPLLSKYRWYLLKGRHTSYAYAKVDGKSTTMHSLLLGSSSDHVDHENRNGLDNVRKNLRPCTPTQNSWNRPAHTGKKYKGVYWAGKGPNPWFASLRINGKTFNLGHFPNAIDAAKEVNRAIRKYHGKFGILNKV